MRFSWNACETTTPQTVYNLDIERSLDIHSWTETMGIAVQHVTKQFLRHRHALHAVPMLMPSLLCIRDSQLPVQTFWLYKT